MVVVHEHRQRPLAAHEERRRAVRQALGHLGERRADLAHPDQRSLDLSFGRHLPSLPDERSYASSMGLDDFPRVPLMFGPSPVHPLPRLSAALGGKVEIWAKREDCNSRHRLRRQQGAQARVPRRRRARPGLRHAGVDRRHAVEPHPRRHRRRAPPRASKAVTVQEHWVDWDDPGYEIVGNIQLTRIMGGDVRIDDGRLRHRHPRQLAGGARVGRGGGRQAVPDPRRRIRPSARRPRLRQLGARGRRAGGGARRLLRHGRSCARSPARRTPA